ncbi:unnamed protein product [marine sediment metagenome]|uniref:DNA/RNA-binding protein Alba-like domain-containing protein n=1 Tax=marine sediment metagenome TaxID=412755 RepID=X1CN65_9ZZZZ
MEKGVQRLSKPTSIRVKDTKRMSEQIVYIGRKPILAYVTAILTSFNRNPDKVLVRARGRSISSAVDAVEVTRNRFMSNLKSEVNIGTEQMQGDEGGTRNVSTIEIILTKSPEAKKPSGS